MGKPKKTIVNHKKLLKKVIETNKKARESFLSEIKTYLEEARAIINGK